MIPVNLLMTLDLDIGPSHFADGHNQLPPLPNQKDRNSAQFLSRVFHLEQRTSEEASLCV
jgi:hypothetical protein